MRYKGGDTGCEEARHDEHHGTGWSHNIKNSTKIKGLSTNRFELVCSLDLLWQAIELVVLIPPSNTEPKVLGEVLKSTAHEAAAVEVERGVVVLAAGGVVLGRVRHALVLLSRCHELGAEVVPAGGGGVRVGGGGGGGGVVVLFVVCCCSWWWS